MTRSKNKSRRQLIKYRLKQIVLHESAKLFPFTIIILDLLDDGQVNGSILGMVISEW
jgi:hypothetical protein